MSPEVLRCRRHRYLVLIGLERLAVRGVDIVPSSLIATTLAVVFLEEP